MCSSDLRVMEGKEPLLIKEIEQKPSSPKQPPEEPSAKVDIGEDEKESKPSDGEAGQAS